MYSASVGDATYKWLTMKIWEGEKFKVLLEMSVTQITLPWKHSVQYNLYLRPQDMDRNVSGFCAELPLWL